MSEPPLVCPVCGTPTVPGARFCFNCGAALQQNDEEIAAERRVVTVLFGDLSDFTAWAEDLDPERVGAVTDSVLAALTRAVTDVDGHVDKLTGDGIMAVFGAPTAHEDDAERAVHAALSMQSAVRRLMEAESGGGRRLGLRVGLNTGEVLAGVQAHLTYTVVGDTVNTASRLADAARIGSVFAGRDTALATMGVASWRALPPLRLKGKREPVPAFELVGLRPRGAQRIGIGADEAPFVGRDAELGRLIGKLFEVSERGSPAVVIVTGEAGVGKTRLAMEFARFAEELPDTRVLWGRCLPFGETRGLAPLAQWVRTAAGLDDAGAAGVDARRLRSTLARFLAPQGGGQAGVLDRLVALASPSDPAVPAPREVAAPGTGPATSDALTASVVAFLEALAADGPLTLVVDDMQWATRELRHVLAGVAARVTGPVLFICVGRSDMLLPADRDGEPHEWWRGLPRVELLPVAPLDDDAIDRLLRSYLAGAELDPTVRTTLLGRAQGNPFFLGELLHLLVDRGLLRRERSGWRLAGRLPADVLPAGVQAVLTARMDTLDPVVKAVLRDASVLGGEFPLAALRALAGEHAGAVPAALDVLADRGLVHPVGPDRENADSYAFTHALARDVAYAAIPKAERARLHAAAAQWAADGMQAPKPVVDEFVAGHAERAVSLAAEMQLPTTDPVWTVAALGAAALTRLGRDALYRDDNAAADDLLTRALTIGASTLTPLERESLQVARASGRSSLLRAADAAADLRGPLQSADPRIRAAALVVHGELLRRGGDDDGAAAAFVTALAMASEAGADRVTAEALRQLGLIDYLTGRLGSAEERFRQSAELAERIGDVRGVGWALQHLAWSATTRGDYGLAEQTLQQAGDVFAANDDTGGLSWCAGTEAFVRLLQGRFREAREVAQTLLPVGEAIGDRWGAAACLTIDGFAAAELGDVTAARERADRAVEEFSRLGDLWGLAMALVAAVAARRAGGGVEDARRLADAAVDAARRGRHRAVEALAQCVLGFVHLDAGDAGTAETAATESIGLLDGMDVQPAAGLGPHVLLAQARWERGAREEALTLIAQATDLAGEGDSLIFPRRQAIAVHASMLLDTGDVRRALAVASSAFRVRAEDVRSRVVALRVLGRCYQAAGDPPAARGALRQALALARSTEQVSEAPATEQVLADVGA